MDISTEFKEHSMQLKHLSKWKIKKKYKKENPLYIC